MTKTVSEEILKNLNQEMVVEGIHQYVSRPFLEDQVRKHGAQEKRQRKLGSVIVMYFILYACLFRQSNREEAFNKLVEGYQIRGWRLNVKAMPTGAALSKAQKRLGAQVMEQTYQALSNNEQTTCAESFYQGLRMKAYDGTVFNLGDTQEHRDTYGKPSTGQGESAWPQLKILMEIDVGTRQSLHVAYGGYRRSEHEMFEELVVNVQEDELVLIDRGLAYTYYLKAIADQGGKFLAHMSMRQKIKVAETLSDGSYLGVLKDPESGEKLLVRVIEYKINNSERSDPKETHRLVTNLLDHKLYPTRELIPLYHERWEIEISFDELRTHLFDRSKMKPFFRSKKKDGVIQELYGMLILYHVIRSFMQDAANKYDLAPRTLSFINCVHILRRFVVRMQAAPALRLATLYEDMLDEMAATLLPKRQNRINPRVVKKHHSKFPSKRAEHLGLKRLKTQFLDDVVMVNHA